MLCFTLLGRSASFSHITRVENSGRGLRCHIDPTFQVPCVGGPCQLLTIHVLYQIMTMLLGAVVDGKVNRWLEIAKNTNSRTNQSFAQLETFKDVFTLMPRFELLCRVCLLFSRLLWQFVISLLCRLIHYL